MTQRPHGSFQIQSLTSRLRPARATARVVLAQSRHRCFRVLVIRFRLKTGIQLRKVGVLAATPSEVIRCPPLRRLDSAEVLGRVKASLAPLAACAALTRPSHSRRKATIGAAGGLGPKENLQVAHAGVTREGIRDRRINPKETRPYAVGVRIWLEAIR